MEHVVGHVLGFGVEGKHLGAGLLLDDLRKLVLGETEDVALDNESSVLVVAWVFKDLKEISDRGDFLLVVALLDGSDLSFLEFIVGVLTLSTSGRSRALAILAVGSSSLFRGSALAVVRSLRESVRGLDSGSLWRNSLLAKSSSVTEVIRDQEAGALLSELDDSDLLGVDNVDASELDDLAFLQDRAILQSQKVFLVRVVHELDLELLVVDVGSFEDDINISAGDLVLGSFLFVLGLNQRRPPGDEFDSVVGKVGVGPVSEVVESVDFVFSELSVFVLVPVNLVVGWLDGFTLSTLVDHPVGEFGFITNEFTSVGEDEVESSESDDVTNIFGLWGIFRSLGVDVNGNELVELDVFVLDVRLEVEALVNDFDLGDILILVFKLERLTDVNNNTEGVWLISLLGLLSDLSEADFFLELSLGSFGVHLVIQILARASN